MRTDTEKKRLTDRGEKRAAETTTVEAATRRPYLSHRLWVGSLNQNTKPEVYHPRRGKKRCTQLTVTLRLPTDTI
ncbi:hypothetical protein [Candidatus Nitrospira allomarina]|uniref:Uncharacterized protein n=1 Tax=Candidatus Nitrospira allomarina TaxID=3020900 RepID=A0AA96G9N2_9BACT|nr:hypothetical protein [Candidatus Nitrospira allomarina]WNM57984.1 hypothetical protein PP769_18740 [Candidatus Nitrospira allomarina]